MSAINAYLSAVASILNEELLRGLSILGEECAIKVKDRSKEESWIDHSGNLRSSIGYAIYEYGKEYIRSLFKGTGMEGISEGNAYIENLALKYSETYTLVVVAGMNYAELVESIESKDVLASTEIWARKMVDSRIKGAMNRASERIKSLKI